MTKYILMALFFLSCSTPWAARLSQNDVSILMPLPAKLADDGMLRATSMGAHGQLLPHALYDKMPDLESRSRAVTYESLRVIGIRIDPCLPLAPPDVGCKTQVRFIWQPIVFDSNGKVRMIDAAIHVFYDLPSRDFSALISQLENLKTKFGGNLQDEILTVNPFLRMGGTQGAYAQELFALILAQVGADRISQATFMSLGGRDNLWTFGGFQVSRGEVTDLPIARITGLTQIFTNVATTSFAGNLAPAPAGTDTFNLLIRNSALIKPTDEPEIIESALATFRVENPDRHNLHSLDCVSCHTAQTAQLWAIKRFPRLKLEEQAANLRFQSRFNLTNATTDAGNTKVLRAFGYMAEKPAVNQRVINETAAVLEYLYP